MRDFFAVPKVSFGRAAYARHAKKHTLKYRVGYGTGKGNVVCRAGVVPVIRAGIFDRNAINLP